MNKNNDNLSNLLINSTFKALGIAGIIIGGAVSVIDERATPYMITSSLLLLTGYIREMKDSNKYQNNELPKIN